MCGSSDGVMCELSDRVVLHSHEKSSLRSAVMSILSVLALELWCREGVYGTLCGSSELPRAPANPSPGATNTYCTHRDVY